MGVGRPFHLQRHPMARYFSFVLKIFFGTYQKYFLVVTKKIFFFFVVMKNFEIVLKTASDKEQHKFTLHYFFVPTHRKNFVPTKSFFFVSTKKYFSYQLIILLSFQLWLLVWLLWPSLPSPFLSTFVHENP